ncbi:MAG: hypothetical protein KA138_10705 [Saprospiraceae bacterium]|nr:hypothetical protein [Saprospiraceae bacterium]
MKKLQQQTMNSPGFVNGLLLCIPLFLSSCAPKILEKIVPYSYSNISFSPEQVEHTLPNGLTLAVTPVDAIILDQESFVASLQDGNYEKELQVEVSFSKQNNAQLRPSDRDDFLDIKIKALEAVNMLIENRTVNREIGIHLMERIWRGPDKGLDGSEKKILEHKIIYPNDNNPFFLDERYMSLFKVTIENNTQEVKKIGSSEFQLIAGDVQLSPYKNSFFEEIDKKNIEKTKNIHRFNMPEELKLTPSQKISKYLAVASINQGKGELIIQHIIDSKYTDFKFQVHDISYDKQFEMTSYRIMSATPLNSPTYYFAVKFESGSSYPLKENYIFVDKNSTDATVSIYGIAVSSTSDKILFGKMEKIRFSDFEKQVIKIPFSYVKQ